VVIRRIAPLRRLPTLLVAALVLAGCGLGAGEEREGGAELRITRDFGRERLASAKIDRVREDQTVMRFLQSERKVETRYGGNFVQAIDGLAGRGSAGRRDWFYFVNGIEADAGAADYELSPGDVVQWDYRNWQATMRIPATVGAYPEPFLNGAKGKRLPVRVECEDAEGRACGEVKRRLREEGVAATGAKLGAGAGNEVVRVIVATWGAARRLRATPPLESGPSESHVFARFVGGGRTLELLDEEGEGVRRVPSGSGLVAATALPDQEIVWLVTAVDASDLEAAAALLEEEKLRDAFAVAATPTGAVRLPVEGREDGR
jgi:Domain of unknown function (DUF4430)